MKVAVSRTTHHGSSWCSHSPRGMVQSLPPSVTYPHSALPPQRMPPTPHLISIGLIGLIVVLLSVTLISADTTVSSS